MSETALLNNICFRMGCLLGKTYKRTEHYFGDEHDEPEAFFSNANRCCVVELLEVLRRTYNNTCHTEVIQILHDLLQYAGHQNEHDMLERTISAIKTGEPRSLR